MLAYLRTLLGDVIAKKRERAEGLGITSSAGGYRGGGHFGVWSAYKALILIRVRQAPVRGHRGKPCMSLCPFPTQGEQFPVIALSGERNRDAEQGEKTG